MIAIHIIFTSLGTLRVEALLGFHAISGCDITGALQGSQRRYFGKHFTTLELRC